MKKLILLLITLSVLNSVYSQDKRLALVIGNGNYKTSILSNPENDALAMQHQLDNLGFTVLKYENLDQREMKMRIDEFGEQLGEYDVGLFFYAGHGIQYQGSNYLIPVDADLKSERQVEYDCVRADRVLAAMEESDSEVNIIILDACRNNPFERSWSRSSGGKGLAFMDAPTGSLIAYATAPGTTASDGSGKNSPYTHAILESMQIPGITILQMFQNVRSIVTDKSGNRQVPWESTSLTGDFYFIKQEQESGITPATGTDITGLLLSSDDFGTELNGVFIDARDNQEYKWIRIGPDIWMAENLNYTTTEGSWCFDNKDSNCDIYGRLYNYKTATGACPEGWHLSSVNEWFMLSFHTLGAKTVKPDRKFRNNFFSKFIDMDRYIKGHKGLAYLLKIEGNSIWQYPSTGSNELGFNALPAGYYVPDKGFLGLLQNTSFWITHPSDETDKDGYTKTLLHYSDHVWEIYTPRDWGTSVRCVKGEQENK